MTALAAAFPRQARGVGYRVSVPLNAGSVVHKGGIVTVDTDGFGRPGADTASYICAGIATESKTGGAVDGDVSVIVEFGREYLFTATSVTQAMLNTSPAMYVVDDNTVDDAAGATNDVFVGVMTQYVSTTQCWVYVPGIVSAAVLASGITANVGELNALDGNTSSAAELSILDASATTGIRIGTVSGTLSSAELLDLKDTPITAIAAPGAGRANIPLSITLFHDHGGTGYVQNAGTDHLALMYAGGVEIDEIGSEAQCTALLEASADAALTWGFGGIGWVPTANAAVQFDNNGATDLTTGNGVLDYHIVYLTVPVA